MADDLKIQATISAKENLSKTLTSLATRSKMLGGRITAALGGTGRSIANAFGRASKAAVTFGLAAGAAAGASLIAATKSYVDQADALGELSARTGLSVESLQEWSYVAERAGVSADEWERSVVKLGSNMGKLRAGGGALNGLLKKVAPSMIPALKATKSTEEAMLLLFDATRQLEDPTQRQALLEAAFGKAGAKAALIAGIEAKEVERLREEKRKYGVITTEAADKAGKLDDAQIRLKSSLGGLRSAIAERLVPVITPFVDKLSDWIAKNKDLIGSRVETTLQKIGEYLAAIDWGAVQTAMTSVWDTTKKIASAIGSAIDAVGGFGNVVIGVIGGQVAFAIAGMLANIAKVRAALMGGGAATAAAGAATGVGAAAPAAATAGAGWLGAAGFVTAAVTNKNVADLRASGDEAGARALTQRQMGGGNKFDAFSRGDTSIRIVPQEVIIRLTDDAKKLLKTSDTSGTRRVGQ